MSAAMSLKTALLGECTSTEVTFVRLLSSVNQLVSLKMLQQGKLLAAFSALVFLYTSMNQLVAL